MSFSRLRKREDGNGTREEETTNAFKSEPTKDENDTREVPKEALVVEFSKAPTDISRNGDSRDDGYQELGKENGETANGEESESKNEDRSRMEDRADIFKEGKQGSKGEAKPPEKSKPTAAHDTEASGMKQEGAEDETEPSENLKPATQHDSEASEMKHEGAKSKDFDEKTHPEDSKPAAQHDTKALEMKQEDAESKGSNSVDVGEDEDWAMMQHRAFVTAIFEIGLKNCSPSVIMEGMKSRPPFITRERTKSHLQKYRKTSEKSKIEFLDDFDQFIKVTEEIKSKSLDLTGSNPLPSVILSSALAGRNAQELVGGEAAASAAFAVANHCPPIRNSNEIAFRAARTTFPKLTEKEKASDVGASLTKVRGLLTFMTDHLLKSRHGLPTSLLPAKIKSLTSKLALPQFASLVPSSLNKATHQPSSGRNDKGLAMLDGRENTSSSSSRGPPHSTAPVGHHPGGGFPPLQGAPYPGPAYPGLYSDRPPLGHPAYPYPEGSHYHGYGGPHCPPPVQPPFPPYPPSSQYYPPPAMAATHYPPHPAAAYPPHLPSSAYPQHPDPHYSSYPPQPPKHAYPEHYPPPPNSSWHPPPGSRSGGGYHPHRQQEEHAPSGLYGQDHDQSQRAVAHAEEGHAYDNLCSPMKRQESPQQDYDQEYYQEPHHRVDRRQTARRRTRSPHLRDMFFQSPDNEHDSASRRSPHSSDRKHSPSALSFNLGDHNPESPSGDISPIASLRRAMMWEPLAIDSEDHTPSNSRQEKRHKRRRHNDESDRGGQRQHSTKEGRPVQLEHLYYNKRQKREHRHESHDSGRQSPLFR